MSAISQSLTAQPSEVADAPRMNREERLTSLIYVSMAALITAFLAITLALGVAA